MSKRQKGVGSLFRPKGSPYGTRVGRKRLPTPFCLLLAACVAAGGCAQDLNTTYGQREGAFAADSVNGTAVLGDMFERAGHKVFSWRALSPKLWDRADVIVWFPDDFEPPEEEVRLWLEDWLADRPGRTLIYVGRDFDAASWYWQQVQGGAPPGQKRLVAAEATAEKSYYRQERREMPVSEDCEWFTAERDHKYRAVTALDDDSDPAWLEGIDASKLEIELRGRLLPAPHADVLLKSEGDALISRSLYVCYEDDRTSQLLVVPNGSFLLNLPLVNHEHRKLAAELIDEVGPPPRTVVFLESGYGGPPIRSEDPTADVPTGMEIFHIWPTNWILLHLAAVGIILCMSRWPIFGRPRQLPPEGTSDFGRHLHALAELLERSRDRAFAMTRVLHYQQTTKSGD